MIDKFSNIERLNYLGVLVGGTIPAAIVLIAQPLAPLTTPALFNVYLIGFGIYIIASTLCIGMAAICERQKRIELVNQWMLICAGVCLTFLAVVVTTTGGPLRSPFSFHFLYIPVVVGLCLTRKAAKMAWIVSIMLAILLEAGQLLFIDRLDLVGHVPASLREVISYATVYLLILIIQGITGYYISIWSMPPDSSAATT